MGFFMSKYMVFNSSAPLMRIRAKAVALAKWGAAYGAATEPPPSPVDPEEVEGGGGAAYMYAEVTLVPYGATELRMGAMPWANPPG